MRGVRRAVRAGGRARDHDERDGSDRHDADGAGRDDPAGRPVPAAVVRRAALVAQHERPARQDAADQGERGRVATHSVPGNLFPPRPGGQTRPEIYAMGFRNPFRIQIDSDDVAYTTDYSPDSRSPGALRGPAGTGRMEIVRKPSNYGWPLCMAPNLPMYLWNFNTSRTLGQPRYECDATRRRAPRTPRGTTPAWSRRRRSCSPTSGTRSRTRPGARRAWRATTRRRSSRA